MATRQVRFEFYCDNAPDGIKFVHDLPARLVPSRTEVRQDAECLDRFQAAMLPNMKQHEAACRAASSTSCGICGLPAVTVLQTLMSWVHKAGDPFVGVLVSAVCGRSECETETRRDVQEELSAAGAN